MNGTSVYLFTLINVSNFFKEYIWDEKLFGGTDTDLFLRFSEKNKFEESATHHLKPSGKLSTKLPLGGTRRADVIYNFIFQLEFLVDSAQIPGPRWKHTHLI